MKKATFTLFYHQRWAKLRKLSLMFLIVWINLGMKCAKAQITTTFSATENTSTSTTLTTCDGDATGNSVRFTDDDAIDGLYMDSRMRRDTVEICPADSESYVRVVTKNFDLDTGDTLFVFDGNKAAFNANMAPVIGTGAGVGVSNGFGGWIDASCDPKVNPSGCLTFLFKTDGDNNKGSGWDLWVDCADRDINIGPVTIDSKKLTINDPAYDTITIPAPQVTGCGEVFPTMSDSVRLIIKNQFGTVFIDTVLTDQGAFSSITDTFAIGIYTAEYTLLSDSTRQLNVPFSVQAPALVCNDNIRIPVGSACMILLSPDDLLESPDDTIPDTMYYNITVKIGTGKNQIVRTTSNFDNHGKVIYPIIDIQDIRDAGMSICNATATVKIERIYYQLGGIETIINNGTQNNSCHTIVTFTDQSAPFITVSSDIDTLVACDTTGLRDILAAKAIDNCDNELPINISVELEETDPCFNSNGDKDVTTAKVTFTAVDDCGNEGKRVKNYTIIRPNPRDHIAKLADHILDCSENSFIGPGPGLEIGTIKNGQFTANDTIALNTNNYVCGYILAKRDVTIPNSECGEKMYRYWDILDWCTPEIGLVPVDTQFIKYTDTKAPEFEEGAGETLELELSPFLCTYDLTNVVAPEASDNCVEPMVRLDAIFRIEEGLPWIVDPALYTQLDPDSFQIRWIAEDVCHEQTINDTLLQTVLIKDLVRPTAICTDRLNISVGSNLSIIDTSDVDGGSYDACGILNKEISRDGVNFGPTVTFSCDDIKDTVMVTFRVTDIHGNTNTCWLEVYPEDKIRPLCTPFATGTSFANGESVGNTDMVRINCNESKIAAIQDKNNPTAEELAAIGGPLPAARDNCTDAQNIELEPRVLKLGVCGENVYQRRWVALDIWGLQSLDTCFQTISVDLVEDWEITFPEDVTMTCPMSVGAVDSVRLNNGTCDRLAVSVETQMFDVVQDACFKIIKTYHIINWCNYQSGDEPTHVFNSETVPENNQLTPEDISNLSYITYTQIIKVDDREGPQIVVGDVDSCLFGKLEGGLEVTDTFDACGDLKTFMASATDCVTDVGGRLRHSYKIYAGRLIDVQAGTAELVEESATPAIGNDVIVVAKVEPGTYTVEFTFTDNCGNSSAARKEYTFKDCTKPTPYLLNGLALELMPSTAQIDIWANDFNQGSYDNCTSKDDLEFRIWHVSLGFNPPTTGQGVLDSLPSSILFNCAQTGTQIVRIFVVDECQNFDFAATFVNVQDNMNACAGPDPDENMVAGEISNFMGESIEGVKVSVNGGRSMDAMTEGDGHYQFMLPTDGAYTITPEKNIDPLNGVSTFDLVTISKHILGIQAFDSPYKYIAADVNKSGNISAFDMVQLRQLILNITSEFPNNSSWRFLDKSFDFSSSNPAAESFTEFITIDNLVESRMNTDFIGIKIGDINGNANVNSLLGTEDRTTFQTFKFHVTDQVLTVGESVKVDFRASDIANIQGYQFTMNFAGLSLQEVEEGVAKATHFNTKLAKKGFLTSSWNGEATSNETLFTLVFKAETDGLLSDLLKINSTYTTAEAYDQAGELMDVGIEFGQLERTVVFDLEQNAPNPFKDETMIGFYLPESGLATLKVLDTQGKVLKTIKGNYEKGYNQISLNAKSLGATGVLYYQLETENHLANKKMIIIE